MGRWRILDFMLFFEGGSLQNGWNIVMIKIYSLLFCALLILFCGHVKADWNQDFDATTASHVEQFPHLQVPQYFQRMAFFSEMRQLLLEDAAFVNEVQKTPLEAKKIILKKDLGLIIKKRRNNHIHEFFAWELSFLLGFHDYVTPSFPVEVGGKKVIVQETEDFVRGDKMGGGYPEKLMQKVSLETYWKANLQAYLLGFGDLAGPNIGISPVGQVVFFDNESSFSYHNRPERVADFFTMGFISQTFDWPHYRAALDAQSAEGLKKFVSGILANESYIALYLASRAHFPDGGFLERLEKVRGFSIKKGTCFRDFFGSLYPKLSLGLDKLNALVSEIYQRPVDHGSALFFSCRYIKKYALTLEQKKKFRSWLNKYVIE